MIEFTKLTDSTAYYDHNVLLERLTHGIQRSNRDVIFVMGSSLTAACEPNGRGVPGVDGVIKLITDEFGDEQRLDLTHNLATADNPYQEAFRFLLGRRSPQSANEIIRKAVASARHDAVANATGYTLSGSTSEEACRGFEADISGWALTPGVTALGQLAVDYPERFGRTILTTNFDPLIGVSIASAGGTSFRTFLHRDGNLAQTEGDGSHVVHLHGYWYGSDTLHTGRQLNQPRPQLRSSLAHMLRNRTVVIMAYGGWDDVFTQALVEVVMDDNAYPEIIWCFYDRVPKMRKQLLQLLTPGIDGGRVSIYGGVNCHTFLPALHTTWLDLETPTARTRRLPLRPELTVQIIPLEQSSVERARIAKDSKRVRPLLANAEQDRPPVVDFLVGRQSDLEELETFNYKIAFITGIGGQGKSALAAKLFSSKATLAKFDHRLWRDCKEQSDTFEDHLVHLIEALNDGRVLSNELSKQPIEDLTELFCSLTFDLRLFVIFDNVDHYVDLESWVLTGAAGKFVDGFLKSTTSTKILYTCRPRINESSQDILSKPLEGISFPATQELFLLRRAKAPEESISKAHRITGGHAFWLDLLAAQVVQRQPPVALDDLLKNIASGLGEIPDATLRSIWESLREREQVVLQSLAETLRPTTMLQLSSYLSTRMRFNRLTKAIRVLRDLNLLVMKEFNDDLGYELHPVIRAFIHKTFRREQRVWFIEAILTIYASFFGVHRQELSRRAAPDIVRRWLEGAELCINAGKYAEALTRLEEVRHAVRRRESPGEFVRVTEHLLASSNVIEISKMMYFDSVFHSYHRNLANLGRRQDARMALDTYEETLVGKDARYINFCNMQTYMHWVAEDFVTAIKWGLEGWELKSGSGVDTTYSTEHNLALAQRDSGAIDPALKYFVGTNNITDVLNPKKVESRQDGSFYGNIGRCFHLMGQIDSALVCYTKSARLVEKEDDDGDQENQAFIRQWIGELLISKKEVSTALYFLVAAREKWRMVSPPKAERVQRTINSQAPDGPLPQPDNAEIFALRWIAAGGTN